MHPPLGLTVALCTLDRGPAIAETVESLVSQQPPQGGFEVLIVDNGSRPENARVLEDLCAAHPGLCRLVVEPVRGLSVARNRAIREARGALLLFLDDDAVATPELLVRYADEFARAPDVGLAGGRSRLRYLSEPPPWLDAELTPYLSAYDQGDAPRDLAPLDCPRGCNMAFRRAVFEDVAPFSDRFGRKGGSLLSLEEVELAWRVAAAGWRIRYLPDAAIEHVVDPQRFTHDWFRRRIHWQGRSLALFELIHRGRTRLLRKLPWHLWRALSRPVPHRRLHLGFLAGAARGLLGIDRRHTADAEPARPAR